jgi:hypothetical protein
MQTKPEENEQASQEEKLSEMSDERWIAAMMNYGG